MLGIIVGSSFFGSFDESESKDVTTDYGRARIFFNKGKVFLQRHQDNTPPHKINHKANIKALQKTGVDKIISICSCGSLDPKKKPGSIVIPEDYIDIFNNETFFDEKIRFTLPKLDDSLINKLLEIAKANSIDVLKNAVYWQSKGPRFETKAEVKMIS
ncbi:MAG: hypothetical protein ACQESF_03965, partial [Nanobdellota archaeon]